MSCPGLRSLRATSFRSPSDSLTRRNWTCNTNTFIISLLAAGAHDIQGNDTWCKYYSGKSTWCRPSSCGAGCWGGGRRAVVASAIFPFMLISLVSVLFSEEYDTKSSELHWYCTSACWIPIELNQLNCFYGSYMSLSSTCKLSKHVSGLALPQQATTPDLNLNLEVQHRIIPAGRKLI